MKKVLKRNINSLCHFKNGKKAQGADPDMTGDCSGLRGNLDDAE